MPKKGKKGGKKKGKAIDLTEPGFIPSSVGDGFFKVATEIGLDPEITKPQSAKLRELIEPNETTAVHTQLILDNIGLGPGGTRALCWSLLGLNLGLTSQTHHHTEKGDKGAKAAPGNAGHISLPPLMTASYRPLTEISLIENRCFDGGVAALANLLNPKGVERGVVLTSLSIKCDHVTHVGAESLAVSLSWNSPLQKLSLNYIPELDDAAIRILCHGLLLNGTLKELSLSYGGYGFESMEYISKLLATPKSIINTLYLNGNYLGAEGLRGLAPGIEKTKTLEILDLSACGLGRPIFVRSSKASENAKAEVIDAWSVFVNALHENNYDAEKKPEVPVPSNSDGPASGGIDPASDEAIAAAASAAALAMASPPPAAKGKKKKKGPKEPSDGRVRLKKLNLLENNLLPEQGEMLIQQVPAKSPLSVLKVDITLPDPIFKEVWRGDSGAKGKKGKKGKKKK